MIEVSKRIKDSIHVCKTSTGRFNVVRDSDGSGEHLEGGFFSRSAAEACANFWRQYYQAKSQ